MTNILRELFIEGRIEHDQYEELYKLYTQSHRKYHNLDYINQMWDDFKLFYIYNPHKISSIDHLLIKLAIAYHDAIYDPTRNDNEELSAQLCEKHLHGSFVGNMIRQTANHLTHEPKLHDTLTNTLMELDILGLADTYDTFLNNSYKIFEEYRASSPIMFLPVDFHNGRIAFFNKLLERRRLFTNLALDESARKNIKSYIAYFNELNKN